MQKALIVGGSPCGVSLETIQDILAQKPLVIGVDYGAKVLYELGVPCDIYCGDQDSLGVSLEDLKVLNPNLEIHAFEREKDATDLNLTVQIAKTHGVSEIILSNVCGGRLDHQLGVLGVVLENVQQVTGIVEDDQNVFFLKASQSTKNGSLSDCSRDVIDLVHHANVGDTVSVIGLSAKNTVRLEGLQWSFECLDLPLLGDRGVSNVVASIQARVECLSGIVCVIVNK